MKKIKIIALVLAVALCFGGCSSTQTLKQLAITEGMGIDRSNKDIDVTVQILNLAKNGTSESLSGNITVNSTENGSTVSDSISKLSKAVSKKLFFGQNKIVVFGSEFAKKGLSGNIDYLVRSSDSRPDVALAISDTTAKKILESKENDNLVPAENIAVLMKNGEKSGLGAYVTVNDAMSKYCNKTSDFYLPVLKTEKDSVRIKGLGLFDGDKMTYVTNDDETFGMLIINGKIKDGLISLDDKKLGKVGAEIIKCKTKLSADIKDGKVDFNVMVKASLMLDETEKGLVASLEDEQMKFVEHLAEKRIEDLCKKAYLSAINASSDCMYVGEYLEKSNKKAYDRIKPDWKKYYKESTLTVGAKCTVTKVNDNSIRE